MMQLSFKSTWLGLIASTLVLSACNSGGGSDGGGGGFQQPSIPNSLVGFDSIDVTETAQIADMGAEMGADLSTPMLFGVQAEDVPERTVMAKDIMDKALRQTLSAITSGSGSVQYTTGAAFGPIMEPCAGSGWGDTGNIIFSGDLTDLDSPVTGLFTEGDTVTMDISNCSDSGDPTFDATGRVTFTFNSDINEAWFDEFSPDYSGCTPGNCVAGMTTNFNNFGGGNNTFGIVLHGDITTSNEFDTSGNESGSLAMNSLWFVLDFSGDTVGLHLRNLYFDATMDISGNYTLDGDFELGATVIGGYINVAVNNIGGNEADSVLYDYPSTGTIVITGANSSTITTTYAFDWITIDLDIGGDGVDLSLSGTWQAFDEGTM